MARCDLNDDGRVDQDEFHLYYATTAAKMFKFQNRPKVDSKKQRKSTPKAAVEEEEREEADPARRLAPTRGNAPKPPPLKTGSEGPPNGRKGRWTDLRALATFGQQHRKIRLERSIEKVAHAVVVQALPRAMALALFQSIDSHSTAERQAEYEAAWEVVRVLPDQLNKAFRVVQVAIKQANSTTLETVTAAMDRAEANMSENGRLPRAVLEELALTENAAIAGLPSPLTGYPRQILNMVRAVVKTVGMQSVIASFLGGGAQATREATGKGEQPPSEGERRTKKRLEAEQLSNLQPLLLDLEESGVSKEAIISVLNADEARSTAMERQEELEAVNAKREEKGLSRLEHARESLILNLKLQGKLEDFGEAKHEAFLLAVAQRMELPRAVLMIGKVVSGSILVEVIATLPPGNAASWYINPVYLAEKLEYATQLAGKELGGFSCVGCLGSILATPCGTCGGTKNCPKCNAVGKEAPFECSFCVESGRCPTCNAPKPGERPADDVESDEADDNDVVCAEVEDSASLGSSAAAASSALKLRKSPSFHLDEKQARALGAVMRAVRERVILREDVAEILAEDLDRCSLDQDLEVPDAVKEAAGLPVGVEAQLGGGGIGAAVEVVRAMVVSTAQVGYSVVEGVAAEMTAVDRSQELPEQTPTELPIVPIQSQAVPAVREEDVDEGCYVDEMEDAGYAASGWAMHNAIKRGHMKNPKHNDPSHPNYDGPKQGRGTPGNHIF